MVSNCSFSRCILLWLVMEGRLSRISALYLHNVTGYCWYHSNVHDASEPTRLSHIKKEYRKKNKLITPRINSSKSSNKNNIRHALGKLLRTISHKLGQPIDTLVPFFYKN
ncbi:hypothetical protein GLYMA_02G275351v4 [Glycine max]|nr:hypothetical protein GLYMA_02G275351v4 [Glycine max]